MRIIKSTVVRRVTTKVIGALLLTSCGASFLRADTGIVTFWVEDQDSRPAPAPAPCRIHLTDAAGQFPKHAVPRLPVWRDHFVCPGEARLELPEGDYQFAIERGPEFERVQGTFECKPTSETRMVFQMHRIADLARQGWYAGDLHVHRSWEDIELLMRAEDLHVAPVITWWNDRNLWADQAIPPTLLVQFDSNRFYHLMAGEDEREGGALMFFNRNRPLAIAGAQREYPSPLKFVSAARKHADVWIDVEKPFWWDVPVWLASGEVDSIGLANNHMCRSSMYETEAWGRLRDAERLPPPRGNGYWSQEIYYHILNCGFRIPPSAGSASGVLPNPVGYNRVYVQIDGELNYADWWAGLKAGRAFVTNGPLLLAQANGHLPGHVFQGDSDRPLEIELDATLTSNDEVPAIKIIKNGRVERAVPVGGKSRSGSLGSIRFEQSGWLLIRAVTADQQTFRFASTAPFYVEIGSSPHRISRTSARFFLDWVTERIDRVPQKLDDPEKLEEVLKPHREAKAFWQKLVDRANAE